MYDADTARGLRQRLAHVRRRRDCMLAASAAAVIACAAAGTPVASAHAGSSCAHARTPIAAAPLATLQRAVMCLINRQRTERGLPRLQANKRLDNSAQSWTNYMVSHDVFTHGSNFAARITASGFDWSTAGENIATGFDTPAAVVGGWMASQGHCRNILTPTYSAVGTGVSAAGVLGFQGTWTQDFGLPWGHRPPSQNWGPADGCPY